MCIGDYCCVFCFFLSFRNKGDVNSICDMYVSNPE